MPALPALSPDAARRVCAIHQPHYLPWLRYLDKVARADVFVVLDDVQFNRNGWQNRNRIKGPQGAFTVTVPVRHRHAAPLPEVEIADDRWRKGHLQALRTSYGRAPGFGLFYPPLAPLLERPWKRLVDLNWEMLHVLAGLLALTPRIVRSSDLRVPGSATERLAHICRAVGATHYLTGAHAAAVYLDPEVLARDGVGLLYHQWRAPTYAQTHPGAGFVPDLSIVDLLASEGAAARSLLAAAGGISHEAADGAPARA